jgi:hypothetical protein
MEINTLIAVGLAGYVVGDTLSPVRRAVYEALDSMTDAVEQDVDEAEE